MQLTSLVRGLAVVVEGTSRTTWHEHSGQVDARTTRGAKSEAPLLDVEHDEGERDDGDAAEQRYSSVTSPLGGDGPGELSARFDAEFHKGLAQVVLDGSGAEEK